MVQLATSQSAEVRIGSDRVAAIVSQPGWATAFARQMPKHTPSVAGQIANLPHSQPAYRLTDLGTLGGAASYAYGLNAVGDVVGFSDLRSGSVHAFLYSSGRMKDLGTLGGRTSYASSINAAGQVVGCSDTAAGTIHAFLYSAGVMTDLGTLGGPTSTAYSINDAGQVVGGSCDSSGTAHAFLYSGGKMKPLGAGSYAYGINAKGQVAGCSLNTGSISHAFLYDRGTSKDLGNLGGLDSYAYQINDLGQVVGYSATPPVDGKTTVHAFLYTSENGIKDLGTLGGTYSQALGVNGRGQVVGQAKIAGNSRAFIYDGATGRMGDLNALVDPALGWTLAYARAINDSGQIAGYGAARDGSVRAFLLTPLVVQGSRLPTSSSEPHQAGAAEPPTIGGDRRVLPMK